MKKIIDTLYRFTHVLELIMGLFVLAAILMEGIAVIQEFGIFWTGTRRVYGIFGAGIKSRSGCGIFKDAAASEHRYDLRGAHVRDRKTYGRKNDDIF